MKKLCLLAGLLVMLAGFAWAGEEYPLTPDSERQPGVPQGTVTKHTWTSKILPGTVRDYWVYVPVQYSPDKPACVMFFEDGTSYVKESGRARIPIVFDNLIAKHDMPVTIAILIDPGVLKAQAPGQTDRVNRSFEYDALSDRYARFLLEEILPEVGKHYNLSSDPNDRAICGGSSGGICSFTAAWMHPEAFHRVLSFIGSFADLRGGDIYPALIRKTEPKPIRVFLQDGNHDLNIFAGDWWLANQSMASALAYAGYDYKFVTGDKDHDMIQGGAILPDALRWLWRDYPQPIAKPGMHHLGDRQTGYVDVGTDWEKVATLPGTSRSKAPASPLLLNGALRDARGIAVDPQGNVFVADAPGKTIYRIDADGRVSAFVKDLNEARGLAFGPDGQLYACDAGGIVRFSQDGDKSTRTENTECQGIAVTHHGQVIHTTPAGVETHSQLQFNQYGPGETWGLPALVPNGISLSPDQTFLYAGDPKSKWVWSSQLRGDGSLGDGEPFFRLETTDEASASGAAGMAVDSKGLLYVATLLGVQVCDAQGRVIAIFNRPEQADPSEGPISGVAFGGADHHYLYAVVGNEIYRRHLVPKPPAP
jgi:gluconolactonase